MRSADCRLGTVLRITGYIAAGGDADAPVEAGCPEKIMTGAPQPPGADAVIPFEETEEASGAIMLIGSVRKRDHIRFAQRISTRGRP